MLIRIVCDLEEIGDWDCILLGGNVLSSVKDVIIIEISPDHEYHCTLEEKNVPTTVLTSSMKR